jgi:hypothetical protein
MIYDDKRKYTCAEIIQVVTDVIFKRFSSFMYYNNNYNNIYVIYNIPYLNSFMFFY